MTSGKTGIGRWERFRRWVRAWVTMPERCRKAERELRLQQNINVHLSARSKRLDQEWERERVALFGDLPGLSPGEIERLAILAGACGDVAQAIAKVLRFGWESQSPYGSRTNRVALEREIGAVRAIVNLMMDAEDLKLADVQTWQRSKRMALARWTLYQECSIPREEQLAMMQAIQEKNVN